MTPTPFQHRHAAHCESGVISNLYSHHGVPLSECMAFGLSAALSFAYLPFIKMSGLPLVAYRMPPRAIIKGLLAPLAARFAFETFRSAPAGQERLDALLAQGQLVGAQTSVYWLPYFPPDMRFHFNAHNLLVYGKDGDDYLVSDPVFEAAAALHQRRPGARALRQGLARAQGLAVLPRANHAERRRRPRRCGVRFARPAASCSRPLPIAGVRGMRMLASKVAGLPADAPGSAAFIGHIVRMQEEIGTGGAGFRFIYAAFLQEAAQIAGLPALTQLADRLTTIGDGWRLLALKAARMVKGRDALAPAEIAARLREQAASEEGFFRDLKTAVA